MLRSPATWVILAAIGIAIIANWSNPNGIGSESSAVGDDRPSLSKMTSEATLHREGTPLHEIKGRFRKHDQSERLLFLDESDRKYKCLENVCLQRVASALQSDDRKFVWLVSGKLTEFNEENFLLLEKATRTR
jgi:hypothetical protein